MMYKSGMRHIDDTFYTMKPEYKLAVGLCRVSQQVYIYAE